MNLSFRMGTTIASKLPSDCKEQGWDTGDMVAYLVKIYNIAPTLVVNNDQTRVHLVLTRKWTWENKGTKHIKVLGMEAKKQITIVVSSAVGGLFLSL
jgi:hypothetical protein